MEHGVRSATSRRGVAPVAQPANLATQSHSVIAE
jgi:hypothetical protein